MTEEENIQWKHCPTDLNIADLGSRGVCINKMEKGNWFTGPEWLLNESNFPMQPILKVTEKITEEERPNVCNVLQRTGSRRRMGCSFT